MKEVCAHESHVERSAQRDDEGARPRRAQLASEASPREALMRMCWPFGGPIFLFLY